MHGSLGWQKCRNVGSPRFLHYSYYNYAKCQTLSTTLIPQWVDHVGSWLAKLHRQCSRQAEGHSYGQLFSGNNLHAFELFGAPRLEPQYGETCAHSRFCFHELHSNTIQHLTILTSRRIFSNSSHEWRVLHSMGSWVGAFVAAEMLLLSFHLLRW